MSRCTRAACARSSHLALFSFLLAAAAVLILAAPMVRADEAPAAPAAAAAGQAITAGETANQAPAPAAAPAGPPPAPVTGVTAADKPSDGGGTIVITWNLSPDDPQGKGRVLGYEILRGTSANGPFEATNAKAAAGVARANDDGATDGTDYYYVVRTLAADGRSDSAPSAPARSSPQWFKTEITSVAIASVIFCAATLVLLNLGKRGRQYYIRPIGGINAIDEAIGRATEMGKPILFVPGLQEAGDVPTIAAFSILGRVAKKVADYQCRLIVPCYYSMVMVVAREVVKGAYLEAGRPDAYREEDVFYVTQEQFAYVAAINGIMLREKPATNFYLGAFFAESLMLAETGFQAGSIQIAGTDQPIQIPFFVAACDYTLIGEELYAAAAYLSDDPKQKATLKAQDFGKAVVLTAMAIGALLWVLHPSWAVAFAGWFHVG
jgi:hypothetical protein